MLRFAPEYQAGGDWPRLAGFVRFSKLALSAVTVTASLAGIALVLAIGLPAERAVPLVAGLLAVPTLTLSELFVQIGRSFGRIAFTLSLSMVAPPVLLVLFTGLLWLRGASIDAAAAATAFLVAQALIVGAQYLNGRRILPREVKAARPVYEPAHWMGVALPLILFSGFIALAQYLDITMLGFRSEEHTSELQSLMRISYAVFCLKKKKT